MTVRGLLLINHRGEAYFIEGGIKADKVANNVAELRFNVASAVEADIPLQNHLIDPNKVKAQANIWRRDWNRSLPDPWQPSAITDPDATEPPTVMPANVGPIVFQAFNVEADLPESGDAIITGSASGIDVS